MSLKNKILHALSNRPGPFNTPAFGIKDNYVPWVMPREARQLQADLYLNLTSTDYYLKMYLSALNTQPDLQLQFDDTVQTYRIADFAPRGVVPDGADFYSLGGLEGRYLDTPPTRLPVGLNYTITYKDSRSVTLAALEEGLVATAGYRQAGNDPEKILHIQWPDGFPFTGPIRLTQSWLEQARVVFTVEPSHFPYSLITNRIKNNALLSQYLAQYGLVDEFVGSFDPVEQLAIALTVIGRSNPAVYPPS